MEKGPKFAETSKKTFGKWRSRLRYIVVKPLRVRAPTPYGCFDGVLLMELVTDDSAKLQPRLEKMSSSERTTQRDHDT